MHVVTLADGSELTLSKELARAGEGSIYLVEGREEWVAKVFHTNLGGRWAKLAKVTAMAASPPEGAILPDGFVVLTWPHFVIHNEAGPCGYVMERIDTTNAVEIHAVTNPSARANPPPSAPKWPAKITWTHLVHMAANLCLAVDTVHRAGAVIGDFQERNILVSDTCRVTLVDCDSIQFASPDGHKFLCTVARPEYSAPELAAADLNSQPRERSSDLFALAIHIHQLLMGGNHPFMRGSWAGAGEQPDALTLAKSGSWAGAPGSPLLTHPLAPPPTFLPGQVAALFERALTDGVRNPTLRPSAIEWREALLRIKITTCRSGIHHIPEDCYPCPWCTIVAERDRRRSNSRAKPASEEDSRVGDAPTETTPRANAENVGLRRSRRLAAGTGGHLLVQGSVVLTALWSMALTGRITQGTHDASKPFEFDERHLGGVFMLCVTIALIIGTPLYWYSKYAARRVISIGLGLMICYTLSAQLGTLAHLRYLEDLGFPVTSSAWLWIAFGLCLPVATLVALWRVD